MPIGRCDRHRQYDDEDDLAAAVAELDERYVEGMAAEEAFTIRRAGDFVRSMATLDGAATLALVHPEVSWTDHRMLGLGPWGSTVCAV